MANLNIERLSCDSLALTQVGARRFIYNGASTTVGDNTDVITVAEAKLTATWNTLTNSTLRKGDLIQILCTDGVILAHVISVDDTTGIATVSWVTETATT